MKNEHIKHFTLKSSKGTLTKRRMTNGKVDSAKTKNENCDIKAFVLDIHGNGKFM